MYRVSSSGMSGVQFLSFFMSEMRKQEESTLSYGELVKSDLLVKRNVLIFMISVFTSVRRTGLDHCFEINKRNMSAVKRVKSSPLYLKT